MSLQSEQIPYDQKLARLMVLPLIGTGISPCLARC
jgi:hypothetical protein